MKSKILRWKISVPGLLLLLTACSTLAFPANRQADVEMPTSGAQLWAENCRRCHNFRSPASLTDSQWEIVMLHMRVRANLTGQEHRAILAFLQSGN